MTAFSPGTTVRCIHGPETCTLCRARPDACGYRRIVGAFGTVLNPSEPRVRPDGYHRIGGVRPDGAQSIRVAFIGTERPSIVPTDQVEVVDNARDMEPEPDDFWQMSPWDAMLLLWQGDMKSVSDEANRLSIELDRTPDGSKKKGRIMDRMDYLSLRRRLIESANTAICEVHYP